MAIETLGAALRQINRLFSDGAATGLSDADLLDRFLAERDGASFEVLLARHGPMVLRVCRGVLHNPSDAEDAFQAAFLILVKKARTLRGRANLGGWLHLVAYRVAIQANAAAARRRVQERKAGEMAAATSSCDPVIPDELLPALHEEVARLPEKIRAAILLCDLQGVPQDQAAESLRLSERTLRRRLTEGRQQLKARLGRRGLAWSEASLAALRLRDAGTVIPPAWREAAVQAALEMLNPTITVGTASAAARSLSHEVLKTMFIQKLTIASAALIGAGLMAWAASAALVSRGDKPTKKPGTPAVVAHPAAPAPAPQPDPLDATGTFPVRGRVLDPDGKPVPNAEIVVRHFTVDDPAPKGKNGRVAVSGPDGRFHFDLNKASSDWPFGDEPAWHRAQIAAVAPGLALAWVNAGSLVKGDEATLRLVRDDVPIHGRVLDPQGRPIAGVTVQLRMIANVKQGMDSDKLLASGELEYDQTEQWYGGYHNAIWPEAQNTWTTDADGRVEVKGLGRDRIGSLEIQGPMLATGTLYVMARPAKTQPKPRPHQTRRDRDRMFYGSPPKPLLFGATFDYVSGPTKPITGVVRSKATGQPVAGIKVYGQEGATWSSVSSRTDDQGRFGLLGLPKGEVYQVVANEGYGADGHFLSARTTVTDTEGLKPIETTLELPRGVKLTGRLIDTATGQPVRAGQVSYVTLPTNRNGGQGSETLKSPTDTTFHLTVPPGEGMLFAEAQGKDLPYTRARLRKADKGRGVGGVGDGETYTVVLSGTHAYKIVDVPADAESFTVDLELTRGFSRKGRVLDPDGQPLDGAQCYGLSATWGDMKTLTGDSFEALGLEPDHPRQLIFAHQGRRLVGSVIIKGEDSKSDEPLVVRLDRPGSIKGRLVDEDGLPLAGGTLGSLTIGLDGNNLPPGPGRDAMWPDNETVTTGADGHFQIDGLKPGVKMNSGVTFKDRPGVWGDTGKVLRDIVLQKPGEIRDLGDIKVKVARQ
jgi:RNA polymerase sigma factor (sigma-70 family)